MPTRAEVREANRAEHAAMIAERDKAAAEARQAKREEEAAALREMFGPKPKATDPDALSRLFEAAFDGLWYVLTKASTSDQDRISAFSVARLAAGVGKVAPPPKEYRLPMASLLPPQGATDAKPTGGDA